MDKLTYKFKGEEHVNADELHLVKADFTWIRTGRKICNLLVGVDTYKCPNLKVREVDRPNDPEEIFCVVSDNTGTGQCEHLMELKDIDGNLYVLCHCPKVKLSNS